MTSIEEIVEEIIEEKQHVRTKSLRKNNGSEESLE